MSAAQDASPPPNSSLPWNGNGFWAAALRAAAAVSRLENATEDDILRAVADQLKALKLQGGVMLLTPEGELEIRRQWLPAPVVRSLRRLTPFNIQGTRFDPGKVDLCRQAFDTLEPVFSPDRSEALRQIAPDPVRPILPTILQLMGRQPIIVAPLVLMGKPIGALSVSATWLIEDHTLVLAALADHIAIALGQVRSRKAILASLERERLRSQVAEAVARAPDLPLVLERVIDLTVEALQADAGAIALVDEVGESIIYPFTKGVPDSLRGSIAQKGRGLTWRLVQTRTPILLEDYAAHPAALPEWIDAGIKAVLGVPLIIGDEVIGGLGIFRKSRGRPFSDEDLQTAQELATMAAIAVKNAQLFAQTKQLAEQSQALIRTSHSISSSLDLDTVLRLIAEEARDLLDSDGSRIHMIDFEAEVMRCLVALDPLAEAVRSIELRVGEGLVGEVARTGVPLLANNPAADPRSVHIPGTPEDEPECLALAPLRARQRTIGVMTVRRIGQGHPYTDADLDLLTAFAAQAAVAIENADLYGQIESQAQRLEQEVTRQTRDLALSEARYRALVETSLAGFIQVDLEGRVVYVNESLADLLEWPNEEILGADVFGFLSEESRAPLTRRMSAGERDRLLPREVVEAYLLSRSGNRIPVLIAVSSILDETGRPTSIAGLVVDISTSKDLEAELRAEKDRLQAILTNVADAVVVTDRDGKIEYVNPAWVQLTGYSAEEALGQDHSMIRSGLHPASVYKDMWDAILEGRPWQGELINRRKDGSTYDAAVTITPVLNDQGKVVNFVGVQHDITSMKEVERLKSQFVSDVSHELRTPLTNIRLYADLLQASRDRPRSDRYLQTLTRESERLAFLIDDLLSLSGLDAAASPFDPRPVDLNAILATLAEDRRTLAAQQGLKLLVDVDPDLAPILADGRLLTQVFTNLLTNAINYTPGGGTIRVSTARQEEGNAKWITVEVADTGLGISSAELPRIFSRFFRGEASRVTGAPGTGLGLAICKEIAELHGGRITVESALGEGSRFAVWLPEDGPDL